MEKFNSGVIKKKKIEAIIFFFFLKTIILIALNTLGRGKMKLESPFAMENVIYVLHLIEIKEKMTSKVKTLE